MQTIMFQSNPKDGFYDVLRQRVDAHFLERHQSRFTTKTGIAKLVFMLIVYALCYALIISGRIEGWPLVLLVLMFGMWAMVAASAVIHDAVHDAFSKKQWVNEFLVVLVGLFGVNGYIWRKTHVDAHHNYTNLLYLDLDLVQNGLVRFVHSMKFRWFHRYQHLYMPVLYYFIHRAFKGFQKLHPPRNR